MTDNNKLAADELVEEKVRAVLYSIKRLCGGHVLGFKPSFAALEQRRVHSAQQRVTDNNRDLAADELRLEDYEVRAVRRPRRQRWTRAMQVSCSTRSS